MTWPTRRFLVKYGQLGKRNEGKLQDAHRPMGRRALPSIFQRCFGAGAVVLLVLALYAPPAFAKYASFVIDADSGRILHSVNADTRNYPASLTKMMTLYLVFDSLDRGKLSLDTKLKVSSRATRQPPSKLALGRGMTISVEEAILALVTKSANDVAVVVAEALSGSERDFALKMTATARRLGMKRTTFRNASGLYNRGQLSTARDMAILARSLLTDFPQYYHYFSTPEFSYDGLTHRNHNHLLASYDGTDGIKTGYIRASGFNLVASVARDGHRVIGVVFGGKTSRSRDRHMAKLLDKSFALIEKQAEVREAKAAIEPPPSKPDAPVLLAEAEAEEEVEAQGDAEEPQPLGDWAVQVGAYSRKNPAYERARQAVEAAPALLAEGIIKVVPLYKKKRRPLFRARIAGLEKKAAYSACRTLQGKGIDCLVVIMKGVQVASNP